MELSNEIHRFTENQDTNFSPAKFAEMKRQIEIMRTRNDPQYTEFIKRFDTQWELLDDKYKGLAHGVTGESQGERRGLKEKGSESDGGILPLFPEAKTAQRALEAKGYNYDTSLKSAATYLDTKPVYNQEFVSKLKTFQRTQEGLTDDGILGENSMKRMQEMLTAEAIKNPSEAGIKAFKKAIGELESKKIPKELLDNIAVKYKSLSSLFKNKGALYDRADFLALGTFIKSLEDKKGKDSYYKEFLDQVSKENKVLATDKAVAIEGKQAVKDAEAYSKTRTGKNELEKIKSTLTDPNKKLGEKIDAIAGSRIGTVAIAAGVVTWIFGWDKMKNSFLGKIFYVLCALATGLTPGKMIDFVGDLSKEGGLGEKVGGLADSASEAAKGVVATAQEGFKKPLEMPKGFEESVKSTWGTLTTGAVGVLDKANSMWEQAKTKVGEGYNNVMAAVQKGALDKSDTNPLQIEPDKFAVLVSTLNNDKDFLNLPITELDKISGLNDPRIKSAKGVLEKGGISDQDLKRYITLLLKQKEDGDIVVRDLFVSHGILSDIVDTALANSSGYTQNEDQNNKIKSHIGNITNSTVKRDIKLKLVQFGNFELFNPQDRVDALSKYLSEKTELSQSDRVQIKEIQKIYEAEAFLRDCIKKIKGISLPDETTEVVPLARIDEMIALLNAVESSYKGRNFTGTPIDASSFFIALTMKRLEIVNKGAELEKKQGVNPAKYSDLLEKVKAEEARISAERFIADLAKKITDIPPADSSLEVYMEYLKVNGSTFKEVSDIAKNYTVRPLTREDQKLMDSVDDILEKLKQIVVRVNEKIQEKLVSIEELKVASIAILTKTEGGNPSPITALSLEEFEAKQKVLAELKAKYTLIDNELRGKTIMGKFSDFLGQQASPKNIFMVIDSQLKAIDSSYALTGTNETNTNLDLLKTQIEQQEVALLQALKVEVALNISNPLDPLKDNQKIQEFVQKIQKYDTIIGGLDGEVQKSLQLTALRGQVATLISAYASAIEGAPDLARAGVLKDSYVKEVERVIGPSFMFIGGLIDGTDKDKVAEAYGKKEKDVKAAQQESKRKAFLEKTILDKNAMISKISIVDKMKDEGDVKALLDALPTDFNLYNLLEVLQVWEQNRNLHTYKSEITQAIKDLQEYADANI